MLTKGMKKYVMSRDKRGYNKSQYNERIRKYAVKALEDLVLIAKNTPEKIQAQIFNEKNLEPFFKVVFNVETEISDKELKIVRHRLLRLFYTLVIALWNNQLDRKLAPHVYKVLKHSPRYKGSLDYLNVIEALMIASMS